MLIYEFTSEAKVGRKRHVFKPGGSECHVDEDQFVKRHGIHVFFLGTLGQTVAQRKLILTSSLWG